MFINLKIIKSIKLKKYKLVPVYFVIFIIIAFTTYLITPIFFNYEKVNKKIQNKIYQEFNLKSSINGKIKYVFWPSPRIKIQNFIIKDFINEKRTLGKVENLIIKLRLKDLMNIEKANFKEAIVNDVEVNFEIDRSKEYINFFENKFNSKKLIVKNAKLNFFNAEDKYILALDDINLRYSPDQNQSTTILKGNILNDQLYVNLKNNKEKSKIIDIKILNLGFAVKINLSEITRNNNLEGSIYSSFKNNKIILSFIFKDNAFIIKNGNFKSNFFDGKIDGLLKFIPFFDFDINIDSKTLNLKKIQTAVSELDEESRKKLFLINKKINGNLNISVDKIYSNIKLVNSLETRLEFNNGNLLVNQLLLDLGKLGAADITGIFDNEKKSTIFFFKKNLFIDNLRIFFNKFSIYKKPEDPLNLFVSGKINFNKSNVIFDEISVKEKFNKEELDYYQKEFNEIVLEDGLTNFLAFDKIKNFIKSTNMEEKQN